MFEVRQVRVSKWFRMIPFRLSSWRDGGSERIRCGENPRAAAGRRRSLRKRSGAEPRPTTLKKERSSPHERAVALAVAALRARRLVSVCAGTLHAAHGTRHTLVSSEHKVHVDLPSSEGGAAPRGRARRGPAPVACAGAMFHMFKSLMLS
jgi:hypothetical protein